MADQNPRLVLNHVIKMFRDSQRGYRAAADLEGLPLKTDMAGRLGFAEVLRGDEVTLRTYESAVRELLPTTVRDVVEEQEREVRGMHARLRRPEPEIETRASVTGVAPEARARSTPPASVDKSSEPATSSRVAEWLIATGRNAHRAK